MASCAGAEPQIRPRLESCTLELDGKTLRPSRVVSPWRQEERLDTRRLAVLGDSVTLLEDNDVPVWTAQSEDGSLLDLMTVLGETAFLVGFRAEKQGGPKYDDPPVLRRWSLATGRWLPGLSVGLAGRGAGRGKPVSVISVAGHGSDIAVLTAIVGQGNTEDRESVVTAYEVALYRPGEAAPRWARVLSAEAPRPYRGAYLWAPRTPEYSESALRKLTLVGDAVIVCAEAMQPIVCFDHGSGKELWRIERAWEFERGFIGPSVYRHYISRFGIEEHGSDAKEQEQRVAAARKAFDESHECAVIAGPFVTKRPSGVWSIFLAVSKAPRSPLSGYLANCALYEFDELGAPISMTLVPQVVRGAATAVVPGGVVWRCLNDSFLRAAASDKSANSFWGPGGSDLSMEIPWFRQASRPKVQAWMTTDRSGDPVAFSSTHAFCMSAGGYIASEGERVFQFPLSAVSLETGLDRPFKLGVPFEGNIALPESNLSRTVGPDGSERVHVVGPYLLAVTQLRIVGSRLLVTLGMDGTSSIVEFELSGSDL